jgi:hypothetical protein
MSNFTNKALSLFPKANVLISLATPGADSIHYNDSAELLNAMLKRKSGSLVVASSSVRISAISLIRPRCVVST